MTSSDSKKYAHLPLVPESVLRRRHDLDDLVRKRKALQEVEAQQPKKRVLGSHFYVKKPESFIARSRSRKNAKIRYDRVKRKGMQKRASNKPEFATKVINTEDGKQENSIKYQSNSVGANMVFVIRIRDCQGTPKPIRHVLNRLRLRNIHEGVFVRYNDETRVLLHTVEPWIVYGRPSTQVIADLIERKGFACINKKERIPLSGNNVIEEQLGNKYHIICKEDLVHELSSVGEAFDTAATFLYPFQLMDSKTPFERQTLKLKDGKDYGDRGDEINDYIQQVL